MNKHRYGAICAFLGILCLGFPALAQEAQPDKHFLPFDFKTKVKPGQFTITPAQPQGYFLIEMYEAPLEPVLQAIARLANRKLIISDEAKERLQKLKVTTYRMRPETPDEAFASFSFNNFSWGKVGRDTYLLVPREKSEAEIAAEKAELAKIEEKLLAPQPERVPDEPQQAPLTARLYLLSPETEQK